jgi:hypothetical protein
MKISEERDPKRLLSIFRCHGCGQSTPCSWEYLFAEWGKGRDILCPHCGEVIA